MANGLNSPVMSEIESPPSAHKDPIRGQFWTLWSATLINRLGTFVVPFMILFLTESRSFSVTEAAFVVSILGAGTLVGGASGGVLSDILGRKPMIIATLTGGALLIALFVSMQSYLSLVIVAFFMGMTLDAYRPVAAAAIVDTTSEQNRAKAFGYLAWAGNVGATVAPLMGGFLIAYFSYAVAFYADAAACLGAAVTILFFYKSKPSLHEKHRVKVHSYLVALKNVPRGFIIYLALIFMGGMVGTQTFATLPLSIVDAGMNETSYGIVMGSAGALALILGLPAARWIPLLRKSTVLSASFVIAGFGFAIFLFADTLWIYIAGIMVWMCGVIIFMPLGPTIAQHLAGDVGPGFVQSMYATAHGMAALFGPLLGGLIYQYLGEAVLWPTCTIAVSLVGLCIWLIDCRHPDFFGAPQA